MNSSYSNIDCDKSFCLSVFLYFCIICLSIILFGANQIIRDILGGRGVSKNVTGQFLLVISLVKFDKTCHMGGGSKKWGKSVTYYLNGPQAVAIFVPSRFFELLQFEHLTPNNFLKEGVTLFCVGEIYYLKVCCTFQLWLDNDIFSAFFFHYTFTLYVTKV
jgi:hypothetical protein